MRNMSRLWTILGVSLLGLNLLWISPVKAVPLTSISWEDFTAFADITSPIVDPLPDIYRFGDAWTEGAFHGTVYSQVFLGKTGSIAEGLYVYVYQIEHKPFPSEPPNEQRLPFGSMSFVTFTNIPPSSYFIITTITPPGASPTIGFSTLGSDGPDSAEFTPLGAKGQLGFTFTPKLQYKSTSYIFGFLHPLPPTTVTANLVDGLREQLNPLVYTPSPEPSSFILLSVGLLGSLLFSSRRGFFRKK